MLPSRGYQGFRTAPIPAGWVQLGESWVLWWSGRQIANVSRGEDGAVRVHLDARKMWQIKDVPAASTSQGKRYAERWCAARLYPEMRLRAAVARLLDTTPSAPLDPLPGLPPPWSSSNRPGAWPRLGRRRSSGSRQHSNRASRRQRQSPARRTPARCGLGQGCSRCAAACRRQATRSCTTLPSRSRSR